MAASSSRLGKLWSRREHSREGDSFRGRCEHDALGNKGQYEYLKVDTFRLGGKGEAMHREADRPCCCPAGRFERSQPLREELRGAM